MRSLAAICFGLAAFGVAIPYTDRAGTALLGLAFFALAGGSVVRRRLTPARMNLPPREPRPEPDDEHLTDDALARLLG